MLHIDNWVSHQDLIFPREMAQFTSLGSHCVEKVVEGLEDEGEEEEEASQDEAVNAA